MKTYHIKYYQHWNLIKTKTVNARNRLDALKKLRATDTCVEVIWVREIG